MSPKEWVQEWLTNCLILDTETTGLGDDAEIVEIAIIDQDKNVLLNSLVKPSKPIPPKATAIHGITNEMVANAPSWPMLHELVAQLIKGRCLVIYNSDYDIQLINQTASIAGCSPIDWMEVQDHCAMHAYSKFYGEPSQKAHEDEDGYRWQSLAKAAAQQSIAIEGQAHRALSDCLTTLAVLKRMAGP